MQRLSVDAEPADSVCPAWLLKAKVSVPPPAPGYVWRRALVRRVETALHRRLTVLQAPAGFGKTTVLADVSRRIRTRGRLVAWLTLDEDDSPSVFGSYAAYAFERAGLDLTSVGGLHEWSSAVVTRRIGLLAHAIERHRAPCLLVLDDVERPPPHTLNVIDLLLKHAPPNLHFAAAFRSNPGLDLAAHILDDSAIIVDAGAFRFARHEIAQFFDGDLSRRKLAAVEKRTAGWPVALRVYRSQYVREAQQAGADAGSLTSNFVGVRLLGDLAAEDRAFLLDLAVFDGIEADLVDEVLGSSDARLRIGALSALDGLLLPGVRDAAAQRIHPLVREYCLACLELENPPRKRELHARIARALVRRGRLSPAWRHARSAGDARLAGELIESVGVVGLWARGGTTEVMAADRFLTPEIMEAYPRLALLRCLVLKLQSKIDEAAALYETVARRTGGFARDREGGSAAALAFDRFFTQAALADSASRLQPALLDAGLPAADDAPRDDEAARLQTAVRHALRCATSFERARFEECREHGQRAQAYIGDAAWYGHLYVSICLGMAAMAQGRPLDAADLYRRARQDARRFFPSDPLLAATTEVVTIELDLERNREKAIQQRTLPDMAELAGGWIDIHAAAVGVRAELACERQGAETAVELLQQTLDDAPPAGAGRLSRHVAALLAACLLTAGRVEDAACLWRDAALPARNEELLDLVGQPWRTMEALSSARVLLLAAEGDLAPAAELAAALCRTASAQGLERSAMRGRALAMLVAWRAGEMEVARERLVEYLRRLREVDYVRPLVRQREASLPLLQALLAEQVDADLREAGAAVLAMLTPRVAPEGPEFTPREQEILADVGRGHRNKEIAERLGITEEGVRYHLKKIYRKTGVSRRHDAVRYAVDRGLLS